ncbi:MAG: entericidin EcnAB [Phycisphaerae bacterium]
MKSRWITASVALFLLIAAMLLLDGCNTWRGAGKDVERTGEKMQK